MTQRTGQENIGDPNALAAEMFAPQSLSCPHALWERLRHEAPVAAIRMPGATRDAFVVARKADIEFVASHPEIYTSSVDETVQRWGNSFGPEFAPIFADGGYAPVHTLVTNDPPKAYKYRKIANEALAPNRVARRRPVIQTLIDELVDAMPGEGVVDFKAAFTVPLPLRVILDLMGLPRSDAALVREFTDHFMELVDPSVPLERALENARFFVRMQKYLVPLVESYRQAPADNFLSFLANVRGEDGEWLSIEEVLSMAPHTLAAGNDTSRNALSTAAFVLASDKGICDQLKADHGLIDRFVDEALRYEAPACVTARQCVQDTTLAGVHIPAGAPVYLIWGSGSRDEAFFPAAEQFRLDRSNGRMHSSFGHGVHLCAGMHLAKAEIAMSVAAWLRHFEVFELAVSPSEIPRDAAWIVRQLPAVPIRIRKREVATARA